MAKTQVLDAFVLHAHRRGLVRGKPGLHRETRSRLDRLIQAYNQYDGPKPKIVLPQGVLVVQFEEEYLLDRGIPRSQIVSRLSSLGAWIGRGSEVKEALKLGADEGLWRLGFVSNATHLRRIRRLAAYWSYHLGWHIAFTPIPSVCILSWGWRVIETCLAYPYTVLLDRGNRGRLFRMSRKTVSVHVGGG